MQVAYFTFSEALWQPLLQRQVLELLADIQDYSPDIRYLLVSFYPWHFFITHRYKLKQLDEQLRRSGITYHPIPSLVPCPIPVPFPILYKGIGWRLYTGA